MGFYIREWPARVSCAELCTGFEFCRWTRGTAKQTQFRITGCRCSTCGVPPGRAERFTRPESLVQKCARVSRFPLDSANFETNSISDNRLPLFNLLRACGRAWQLSGLGFLVQNCARLSRFRVALGSYETNPIPN